MYCSVANTKANQYFFRSQSLNEFYFSKIHSQGTFLHIIMMGPFSLLKGLFFQLQFPEMCFAFTLKTLLRTMPGPESKEINFVRRKKKRGGKKGYKYIKHFLSSWLTSCNTYSGMKYGKK